MREFLGGRGRVVWMGGNGVEGEENIFYLILIAVLLTRPCFAHSFNSWISPLLDLWLRRHLSLNPVASCSSLYRFIGVGFSVHAICRVSFAGGVSAQLRSVSLFPAQFSKGWCHFLLWLSYQPYSFRTYKTAGWLAKRRLSRSFRIISAAKLPSLFLE